MSQELPSVCQNFQIMAKLTAPKAYQQLTLVCATSFLRNNRLRDKKVVVVYTYDQK